MKKLEEISAFIQRQVENTKFVLESEPEAFEEYQRDILIALLKDYNLDTAKEALKGNTKALFRMLLAQQAISALTSKTTPQKAAWRTEIAHETMKHHGAGGGVVKELQAAERWVNAAKPMINAKLFECNNEISREDLTDIVREKLLEQGVNVPGWTQIRNTIAKLEKDGVIIRHKPAPKAKKNTKAKKVSNQLTR